MPAPSDYPVPTSERTQESHGGNKAALVRPPVSLVNPPGGAEVEFKTMVLAVVDHPRRGWA